MASPRKKAKNSLRVHKMRFSSQAMPRAILVLCSNLKRLPLLCLHSNSPGGSPCFSVARPSKTSKGRTRLQLLAAFVYAALLYVLAPCYWCLLPSITCIYRSCNLQCLYRLGRRAVAPCSSLAYLKEFRGGKPVIPILLSFPPSLELCYHPSCVG